MPGAAVLGLDFGGSKIAAAVADLDGRRLVDTVVPVPAGASATTTLHQGLAAARTVLAESGGDLVGVGACTFGIPRGDRVDLAPTIPGWEDLPFDDLVADAFPDVPVRTANDVKAAAQWEVEGGALAGCDPGLYLNLGTGLAAAVVVGGVVLAGRHQAAGEIGYNLRRPTRPLEPGSLEDAVSGKALDAAATALLGAGADAAALFARAGSDPAAADLVTAFVTELAFHLVNLAVAVDPQRIVVGGGLVRAWPLLGPRLREALDGAVPFPPELTVAANPYDAPLLGALALGRSAARDTHAPRTTVSEGAPA